jgi:arylsulfatase A-like enzyme
VGPRVFAAAGCLFALAWFWFLETGPSARRAPSSRAAGTHSDSALRPSKPHPNILLLGIDSLRPDKIEERTTPTLARLCRESIYFPNALVTLPRTAPSWVALLTSLPPLANGVETMFPTSTRAQLSELAMPAHLASLGYATSVTSEYAGEFFDRVALGFERRSVPRVELEQILGQALLGRAPAALALAGQFYASATSAVRLLPGPLPELLRGFASFSDPRVLETDLFSSIDPARPWFALLFYSQPHFPYTSSSPYYERYAVAGSDPALRFGKDVTRGDIRTDLDRAQIEALYRGALAETDAAVGDVLSRLESTGELDDTIVILTSDHGEGLYECPACVGHGDNLTGMMTLKVPLAFRLPRARFPRAAPVTVTSYVSQLDVYPTVLGLLGVPRLPVEEGIALLSADGAAAPLPEGRIFFAETGEWLWPTPAVPAERLEYPPITAMATVERDRIVIEERFLPVIRAAKHRAALLPPWKLVYRPGPTSVAWSLYDVEHDPFEVHNLGDAHPDKLSELRSALVHSVLRFSHVIAVGDYFLTRPPAPPEEYY